MQLQTKKTTKNWLSWEALGWLTAGGVASAGSAWAWARFWEPYWLEVSQPRVCVGELGIASGWKGFKVAFLSDLHMGRTTPPIRTLWNAVERVIEARPQLVALGGDYFTKGRWNPHMADLLRPLTEAGLPVVGVLGNHDYYGRKSDYLRIQEEFTKIGVRILTNEAYQIEYNGERSWLAGIDDAMKGEPDPHAILRQLPPGERPLILLSHNPDLIEDLPEGFATLTLSGHTHGGQINPALPPFHRHFNWIKFVNTNHHSEFPLGGYHVNGTRLYVGKGLGMSGYQLRFNARPELVLLELV